MHHEPWLDAALLHVALGGCGLVVAALAFWTWRLANEVRARRQAETSLLESQEKYRLLIETTDTGYVILDPQGRVTDANPEYLRLTGRARREEILGHSVLEWTAPQDLARNEAAVRRCLEEGSVRNLEIGYVTPAGPITPVEITATVLGRGVSPQILSLCRDITERRRAEDALRESESRFREIIEGSQDVIYRQSFQDGTLDYMSPSVIRVLGYTPEEMCSASRDPAAQLRMFHPADLPVLLGFRDDLSQADASGARFIERAFRMISATGDTRWIRGVYRLTRDDAGHPSFILGTLQDITDRRQAEEALQHRERLGQLITGISSEFVNLRSDEIERAIHHALELIGEFTGADRSYLFFFRDGGRAFDNTHEWCAEGVESHRHRLQGLRAEDFPLVTGPIRRSEVVHIPRVADLPGEAGPEKKEYELEGIQSLVLVPIEFKKAVVGFLGLDAVRREQSWAQDIVALLRIAGEVFAGALERERAEREKSALQSQLMLAQKMESVGRLAGGVAHDFNNMLSAILGHVELAIMDHSPSGLVLEDLRAIQQAAQRSAELTRQLLAFARKQTVAPKVLDLNDTVANVLKLVLRLIGEDIELVWMPEASLWPVRMDPSQIDQILVNLCVNARDAIAGVGKVTIETENVAIDAACCAVHPGAGSGEYVMLAVSDDGCGMAKNVLDHLFEPFFTTKEVGKGTGLGLATVYGIVRQNDGFIDVHSGPGEGATFRVYLPRFVGDAGRSAPESSTEAPTGRGEVVLLVEDEAGVLELTRQMLVRLGYTVVAANAPGEALRLARAHRAEIKLLITDVIMPEMNGRDLARAIDEIIPGLKCLYTSGYTDEVIAHHGVLDPCVHFLQKPFSLGELANRIRQALERG